MADPLIIAKSVSTVLSTCWTVSKALYDFTDKVKTVDDRTQRLSEQLNALCKILRFIRDQFKNQEIAAIATRTDHLASYWKFALEVALKCQFTAGSIYEQLKKVVKNGDGGVAAKTARQVRLYFAEDDLETWTKDLDSYTRTLELSFHMIHISLSLSSYSDVSFRFDELDRHMDDLARKLDERNEPRFNVCKECVRSAKALTDNARSVMSERGSVAGDSTTTAWQQSRLAHWIEDAEGYFSNLQLINEEGDFIIRVQSQRHRKKGNPHEGLQESGPPRQPRRATSHGKETRVGSNLNYKAKLILYALDLGREEFEKENYPEAEEVFLDALKMIEDNRAKIGPEAKFECRQILAQCYRRQRKFPEATKHLNVLLDCISESGTEGNTMHSEICHSLAEVLFESGKFSEAQIYCDRAIQLREKIRRRDRDLHLSLALMVAILTAQNNVQARVFSRLLPRDFEPPYEVHISANIAESRPATMENEAVPPVRYSEGRGQAKARHVASGFKDYPDSPSEYAVHVKPTTAAASMKPAKSYLISDNLDSRTVLPPEYEKLFKHFCAYIDGLNVVKVPALVACHEEGDSEFEDHFRGIVNAAAEDLSKTMIKLGYKSPFPPLYLRGDPDGRFLGAQGEDTLEKKLLQLQMSCWVQFCRFQTLSKRHTELILRIGCYLQQRYEQMYSHVQLAILFGNFELLRLLLDTTASPADMVLECINLACSSAHSVEEMLLSLVGSSDDLPSIDAHYYRRLNTAQTLIPIMQARSCSRELEINKPVSGPSQQDGTYIIAETLLKRTVQHGIPLFVNLLLGVTGIDVNTRTGPEGETALHLACRQSDGNIHDIEIIESLLSSGGKKKLKTKSGSTPRDLANFATRRKLGWVLR